MTKIEVIGNSDAARNAALEAARIQAKVCLAGCEHCIKVLAEAPAKIAVGQTNVKIHAAACCVRTKCAVVASNTVRPPKNVEQYTDCQIRRRAEKKAAEAIQGGKAA